MSVLTSVPEGEYLIKWIKTESDPITEKYLDIQNQILTISTVQQYILKPTFDVEKFFYTYIGQDLGTTINL